MAQWKIIVSGKEYEISIDRGNFLLNGKSVQPDIAQVGENEFSVILDNQSFNAEVTEINRTEKRVTVKINGNEYAIELKDKFDLLLQKMGMTTRSPSAAGNLKAPMPGKVLRVDVTAGQALKKGDSVLVLEAMKMENAIKASGDGKVKKVQVKPGDAVEKGQVMIEME